MDKSQADYFRSTRVAILFNTQAEHRRILEFFGLQRKPLSVPGACSVHQFYAPALRMVITYHWHPLPSVYSYNRYVVISFWEFEQITGDGRIRNLAPGVV